MGHHLGKTRYATAQEAEMTIRAVFDRTGESMVAYPCDECAGWHIGHPRSHLHERLGHQAGERLEQIKRELEG